MKIEVFKFVRTIEMFLMRERSSHWVSDKNSCNGIIPDTFIMCGEAQNYCSGACYHKSASIF